MSIAARAGVAETLWIVRILGNLINKGRGWAMNGHRKFTWGTAECLPLCPKAARLSKKAARLSPLQLAHLDMCVTAAFTRPDSYIRVIEHFTAQQHGSVFDFYHIELAEMAFILVV